jgi:hypothetical protein
MPEGYIYAFKVNGVPKSYFNKEWRLIAVYITSDYTKVYGVPCVTRMQDWFEGYVNIPIYVNTDEKANKISFKVRYNNLISSYTGFDTFASLFQDVEVDEIEPGLLSVVINSDEPVELYGSLVSLRFKILNIESVPPITTYYVFEADLKEGDKQVNINIPDGKYNRWVLQAEVAANKQVW